MVGLSLLAIVLMVIEGESDNFLKDCKDHFLCTPDVCAKPSQGGCGPAICPAKEVKNCTDGVLLSLYEVENDFCECCPQTCVKYLEEGAVCSHIVDEKYPTVICGPQLECRQTPGQPYRCLRMSPLKSHCLEKLTDYEERDKKENVGIFEVPPICTDDGEYAPVQCYGDGLCHCVDKDDGRPIFGLEGSKIQATQSEMNCLCSRFFSDAISLGCRFSTHYKGGLVDKYDNDLKECEMQQKHKFFKYGSIKCAPNGNAREMQCVSGEGQDEDMCLCLDPSTLKPLNEYEVESQMELLSCYEEDFTGPCQMFLDKNNKSNEDLTWYIGYPRPSCTPDGFYGPIQLNRTNPNHMYCSDREGNPIEEFGSATEKAGSMNCECALARKYIDPKLGLPTCCSNGNYKCWQCKNGFCFCVDSFGKQIGMEVEQMNLHDLKCKECCLD